MCILYEAVTEAKPSFYFHRAHENVWAGPVHCTLTFY